MIQTRRELARHLQAQMEAARGRWSAASDRDDADESPGRTLVKTYLLEAHCAPAQEEMRIAVETSASRMGLSFAAADDPDLFRLAKDGLELWCDTSMGRYWRVHTTAPVATADPVRDALVSSTPWLDKVWLPPDYLEDLPERVGAQMLTFSMSHDRRPLEREGDPATESDFVTLRLWSSRARDSLRKLRAANVFPHGVSLRSVRLRSEPESADVTYVGEYFRDGKITASGTSFDEHSRVLTRVVRDYAALVEGIERRYALAARNDAGAPEVVGDPIVIDVDWTLPDLEYAVSRVFSSAEPFRLWGVAERIRDNHFRARATDLHVGGVLTFDITPNHVVIQLPRGVCGNTVVRFMNNLRFHVNSDAKRLE